MYLFVCVMHVLLGRHTPVEIRGRLGGVCPLLLGESQGQNSDCLPVSSTFLAELSHWQTVILSEGMSDDTTILLKIFQHLPNSKEKSNVFEALPYFF